MSSVSTASHLTFDCKKNVVPHLSIWKGLPHLPTKTWSEGRVPGRLEDGTAGRKMGQVSKKLKDGVSNISVFFKSSLTQCKGNLLVFGRQLGIREWPISSPSQKYETLRFWTQSSPWPWNMWDFEILPVTQELKLENPSDPPPPPQPQIPKEIYDFEISLDFGNSSWKKTCSSRPLR